MASKHDINLNINDKSATGGAAGRPTKPSGGESAAIKSLINVLERALSKNAKDNASAIEKAVRPLLKEVLRSSSKGQDLDVNRLVKGIGSEVAKEINKSISKSTPTSSSSSTDVSRAVDRGINKLSEKLSRTLSSRVTEQTGMKIDERSLANSMANALKPIVSKTGDKPRELQSIVDSLKNISKEISTSVRSIKTAASSGGKIDISEIPNLLSEINKLSKSLASINKEAAKAKDTFAKVAADIPDLKKEFNKALGGLKGSSTKTVKGVLSSEAINPKALAKEITSNVIADVKRAAKEDSSLGPVVKKLESASSDLSKFAAEIKDLKAAFKQSGTNKKEVAVRGADKLAKTFNDFTTALNKIPTDIGFAKMPPAVKELLEGMDQFAKKVSNLTSKVKLVVDDSELKKITDAPQEITTVLKPETKTLDKTLDSKPEMPVSLVPNKQAFYKEINNMLPKMEKAAHDLFVAGKFANIKSNIELGIKNDNLAAIRTALNDFTKLKLDLDIGDLKKKVNELRNVVGIVKAKVETDPISTKKAAQKASKIYNDEFKKHQLLQQSDRGQMPSMGRAMSVPRKDDSYTDTKANVPASLSKQAAAIQAAAEANIAKLGKSLNKLQTQIVNTLDKQFAEAGKKWAVVKSPSQKDPTQAFKLATGGRQHTLQIANLNALQTAMKDFDSSVDKLLVGYKKKLVSDRSASVSSTKDRAELVGQWLKTVSSKDIQASGDIDQISKTRLVKIKEDNKGVKVSDTMRKSIIDAFGEVDLKPVFEKTYGEDFAKRKIKETGIVKTLALPAFQKTKTQDPYFQTVHGSQRALPKFVKFQTGFENLYDEILKADQKIRTANLESGKRNKGRKSGTTIANSFSQDIRELGVRPSPNDKERANRVAADMFKALENLKKEQGTPREARDFVKQAYVKAAQFKGVDLEKAGVKTMDEFNQEVQKKISEWKSTPGIEQSVDTLMKSMEQLNLTAYDAVRSLSKISSLNVYDVMGAVLQKGDKAPLKTVAKQPYYERSVREFEKAIGEIEGTMPLFESNRPRRAMHQENVTNLLTRTSPIYDDTSYKAGNRLDSDAQKRLIKDLNLEFNELFKKADIIGRDKVGIPTDIRRLSSLGIPESQAGSVVQYRPNTLATGKTEHLNKLSATSVTLYADNLTELAPFQQFQQAGRNISNITNAMIKPGAGFETPKLRSERERDIIQSGRYGDSGYGLNVTAELRNTAANFEDQIVISGKIAAAMTKAVKTLIKPSPLGRTTGATEEDRVRGTGVTEITKGEIDKVTKKYMEILGAPEEYKGRADKAFIDEVQKAVSVVRGESVEVQQAKLAEVFLNNFGRKLTTRYGSKGVSVTPTGQQGDLANIIQENFGKKITVDPTANLGYQKAPKSLGKLATELFGDDISEELKQQLILSGNKFMIDIFQNVDTDIVDPKEADRAKDTYNKFAKQWAATFGEDVPAPKVGIEGVKQLRDKFISQKGEAEAFDIKPIEVRISSYGAAKRGLQTEFMESIFSNLASTGSIPGTKSPGGEGAGFTTLKKLQKKDYVELLGKGAGTRGTLAKYSEALGYKGSGKTEAQLAPELFETFGGKGDYSLALKEGDSKAVLAKQAAAVEAATSYYSDIIDEFGNARTGLVGEKFVKIVEEPTKNPEWQRDEVERGLKGARLNLPAFSAYASVFGEQSEFMKELEGSLDINAKKHWEYMKSLQTIQGKDSKIYSTITKDLDRVSIKDVRPFYKSTGVYDREMVKDDEGKAAVSPRSFADSILDIDKFSKAFMLKVSGGKLDPSGKPMRTEEELYIPGALARGTYDEPLIAGERGMDQVARRMTHMVNMASELDTLYDNPEKALMSGNYQLEQLISGSIGALVQRANKELKGSTDPAAIDELSRIMATLEPLLSNTAQIDPKLMGAPGRGGKTEAGFFAEQVAAQLGKGGKVDKGKSPQAAMGYLVSTLGDLLIGKRPTITNQAGEVVANPEHDPNAMTGVKRAAMSGGLPGLGAKIGPLLTDELIKKKIESFQKAKIEYYNTLADTATGKSGSVNELLFSRKIPAVMGKATTAVVDKQKDVEIFQKRLLSLDEKYGLGLEKQALDLTDVAETHGKAISKYKKIGIPILGQDEIGVPEQFAEKIPLEFKKKYDVDSKLGVVKKDSGTVKSTLAGLLKYAEKLREASSGDSYENIQEIEKYINTELVPYIESIRFPFTGTSSIAPFKPRLVKEGQHMGTDLEGNPRSLEKNVLMVPGVPEGLEGLAPIIEQVQKRIDTLVVEREKEQTAGAPMEVIDEFTKMIRELSAAVSDVIPKYTSQAQKLDFDGDQIEIHAARTASARKNIEEHFKRFHIADPKADIRTQDVFMKRFLSEAAEIKTTGSNVFGEAAGAFEKKFPAGKGFEFMKSPFLTEDLEYLDSRQALDVLGGNTKQFGSVSNVVRDVLKDIGRPEDEITNLISQMDTAEGKLGEGEKFSDAIMGLVENKYKEANAVVFKQIETGIKKRLYEEKLGDTIEAQLFKVHTGPETEGMYRVHRLAEDTAGFSGGLLGGKANSSEYFKQRFPDMKAMGGSPEEEFHTMVNEFLRFGIQKGMDVKHAGEKPVAGEMISYLSKGIEGAGELWENIQDKENKTYGDLREFASDSEKTIRMRLGELPTNKVLGEAKKITTSRGGSTVGLDMKTREELIKIIVEKIGFKGFLEEMSLLIEKSAVEGLIQQAEEWSPQKRGKVFSHALEKNPNASNRELALSKIQYEKETEGINIARHITPAKSPLYGSRTFSASPYKEFKKYEDRFGAPEVDDSVLAGIDTKQLGTYKEKYQNAIATAANIQRDLQSFSGSKQTGAYADMIRSSIDTMYKQQDEIKMHVASMEKEGYEGPSRSVFDRVIDKAGVPTFVNDVITMKTGMKDEVERLSELAGVPGLSSSEKFDLTQEYGSKLVDRAKAQMADSGKSKEEIESAAEKYASDKIDQIHALKQLDRVVEALYSKKNEEQVLQELYPKGGQTSGASKLKQSREEQFRRVREERNKISDYGKYARAVTAPRAEDAQLPPESGSTVPGLTMAPAGIVKVHLVGADAGAIVSVNLLKSAGLAEALTAPSMRPAADPKVLDSVLARLSPETLGPSNTAEYFSPSRLGGGGDTYGPKKKTKFTEEKRMAEQLERLFESLTTEKQEDPGFKAIVDWGTILHAKVQKFFKDQQNVDIERYGVIKDKVGGIIGGTADMIEYDTPAKEKVSKIIDIKSSTSGIIGRIEDAVKDAGGSTNVKDVAAQADPEIARKLNEYFSQLNTYLKIFDETATAELRFYDKEEMGADPNDFTKVTMSFDPKRFKKDMMQLASAREMVKASGKEFMPIDNVPYGAPDLNEWPAAQELDKAMKEAKSRLESTGSYGEAKRAPREDDEATNQRGIDMEQRAAEFGKNRMFDKLSPKDLEKYLVPPKIAAGNDVPALLENLTILHDQAKIYQKMKGVDMGTVSNMPKEIGKSIGKVGEEGPDYQSFIELTGKLKEMERPDFNHKDFINAWKMYRAAVGDFKINLAENAEKEMRKFEEQGDERGANQAYGEFEKRTQEMQEFIRRSIGKPTDLYTDDKRFVYPGLAQAAGVYMSPEQIHGKVGQGLGDDEKLIDTFKTITRGLQENEMPSPLESAQGAFSDLSDMKLEMVDLLNNAERFGRLGPEIVEAWDFEKLSSRATRLREALQQVAKQSVDMTAEQKKYLENNIKYLKNIEGLYSHRDFNKKEGYGQTGIIPVPKFETPEVQRALHKRNIQSVRQYFTKPEEEGGPEIGERFSYQEKIVGAAGETIKNVTHNFQKYGEEIEMTGQKTGQFSESQQDLIEKMQRVNASFSNAVRRVIMWGAASRLVYGGVSNLKSSLDELANIEVGIAQLRMVMSPLETDFGKLSKGATGLAKQYGVPVTDVLKSMKVFAQQGLKQGDVMDRTQTATLASNVTTLNAKEATEALTSAMKVFREEGSQSLRFLDAWSEVEAKHAITAEDMANAIKKSAAAAKSAGVSFDQLNGMVAAVGAVTRQTGKEVGTSFRFIFRRLFSEEGPKALAKLKIPTIDEAGELRPAMDILGDLSSHWGDLSSAQRMNVAQAIGGTRQYNTLLVLMDQWDEALRGIKNSTNSKGSAERRNAEIMKTYAKQLERTKAAATEFKMEIGKIALPVFTAGTKGLTMLFEALTAIPAPIKIAATALAGFFTLSAQGINIFDSVGDGLNKAGSLLDDFSSAAGKQFSIAKYEVTGKAKPTTDTFGLSTLTPYATKVANTLKSAGDPLVTQGSKMEDFHSSLGKLMFQMMDWGRSYNEMIGGMAVGTGGLAESLGETGQRVGSFLSSTVNGAEGIGDIISGFQEGADLKGLGFSKVKKQLTKEGVLKGGSKVLAKAGAFASEVAGIASYAGGQALDTIGEGLGAGGQKILKDFTTQNAGFVKSVAPLALTVAGLIPALKAGAEYFKTMTGSAQDFEASMDGARRKNESQLSSIREMIGEYDALEKKVADVQKVQDPATKAHRQELGTYEAPLTILEKTQQRAIDLSNQIASSNVNLVVGYDKLGNAVLKTGKSFKSYLKDLENLEVRTGVATELEVLTKYLDDLAEGSRTEKIKQAFKELAEAFPVVGNLVARNIKVSPAKSLEIASEDLNKRLNIKQKYPLSAAADADIERLQGVLKKARDAYQTTFKDAQRVREGILSPAALKGLSRDQIEDIVKSPELRRAYEAEIKINPRFKLLDSGGTAGTSVVDKELLAMAKKAFGNDASVLAKFAKQRAVTWQDIMGKELITALNPKLAGKYDVVSQFTKANLESAGVAARTDGKAASGDVVTFYKYIADAYDIAGQQAIVKMKGTDEWVIEYFNTRTLELEERSLSDVEQFVDAIFPADRIQEDLSNRLDSLNTFVAGAGAGLVGVSAKDFKKDFDLGQRFFSDLPTSNILQGSKGFTPGVGYGEVEGMKDFQKDIQEYFFKPMENLRRQTEQFDKLKLEGLESGSSGISKDFYDEINRLLNILKNNQVVIQFRAVFVDLMKEMSLGQRVLKEEIAIMRRRSELDVTPSGLTAGVPRGLDNLDIGVRDQKDVTAMQRLLSGNQNFRQDATRIRELELTSQSNLEMIDKFERAGAQLDDILATATGFGAALNPEDLGKYIEKVVPERDDGPFYELSKSNKAVRDNTADTVDRLDKLLENQGDPEAIEKYLSSITDNFGAGIGGRDAKKTTNALERVARIRESAEGRGDQETVMASNNALDILTKQLVAQVGYKKGIEMIDDNFTLFSKKFKPEEFQQRAFGGIDTKVFLDKLQKAAPEQEGTFFGGKFPGFHNTLFGGKESLGESDAFKDFQKVQEKQYKETTFSSKNMARVAAVAATISHIQQSGNKKIIGQLDDQIGVLDDRLEERRVAGASPKELTGLTREREALNIKRTEKQREAGFYGTVKSLAATKLVTTELGRAMGFTETQMKVVGASAVGLYASMMAASKLMGEELPESAKKFGSELKELGKKVASGDDVGFWNTRELKSAGEEMQKEFSARSKDIFGKDTSRIGKTVRGVDTEKLIKDLDASLTKRREATDAFKEKGPLHTKYAALMDKQLKERADLYKTGKQGTPEFKDLVKGQNAERAKFLRELDAFEKKEVLRDYSKLPGLGSSKEIQGALGPDLDKLGDVLTRGLESAEAPSKLKQLVAAWLSIAVADAASNATADKVALAETEKYAKQQAAALDEVRKQYPEAFDKVLADMQKDAGRAAKEVTDIATIDKSLVQDPRKAKAEVQKLIDEQLKEAVEQQKKVIEEQRKAQNKAFDTVRKEEYKMSQEQAAKDSRTARDSFNITRKYSLQNLMNSALKGYGGDVELPLADQDMSTQQRVYKEASSGFRNVIDSFTSGVQSLDRMKANLDQLKQSARVEEDLIMTSEDADVVKMAKERHSDLTQKMKDQIAVIEKMGERLRKIGELKSAFDQFAGSINTLKDALRDVGVQEAVERIPGMEGFNQARDRLLGGSDPNAIVPISTEQEHMGNRVGVPLRHMRSTQYDVRRAELMDQMRNAEGEQYFALERQLNNLPDQQKRDEQVYAQRNYDQRTRRGLQPYEDLQANLERARIAPGTTGDMRGQIEELQTQIGNTLSRAFERIPIDEYIGQIEANRGNMTDKEYDREMARALEVKDKGITTTYRQVPTWEKNVFSGLSDDIKAAMQAAMEALPTPEAAEMKNAIAVPITQKIDMTNDILRIIAEKEFGLDVPEEGEEQKQGIFSKLLDAIKGLFGMSTDKKALGGHISGPGGPTTDSIPALLSDGEYVVRAASVSKLGTHVLDHINKFGQVPKFGDGGYMDPGKHKTGMTTGNRLTSNYDEYIDPEKDKTGIVDSRLSTSPNKPSDRDFDKFVSKYYNPKEVDVPWIKDRHQFEEGSRSSEGRVIHGKFFSTEELGGLETPIFDPVSLFSAGVGGTLAGGLRKATLAMSANPQIKQIFKDMGLNFAAGGPASFADYLTEQRMGLANKTESNALMGGLNLASQGALAAVEVPTKFVEEAINSFKMLGDLDAKTVNSMVEGVKERGLFGTLKDIGKGIGSSFMGDLKTGGTGITAGVLGALIPGAGALKGTKLGERSLAAAKNVTNSVMKSELGAVGLDLAGDAAKVAAKKSTRKIKLAGVSEGRKMLEDAASIYKKDAKGLILGEKAASTPAQRMVASEDFNEISKYLPKDSKYLTSGEEAAIFDTGKGAVARAAPYVDIPKSKHMLQPLKRFQAGEHSVDYFPKVRADLSREEGMKHVAYLEKELEKEGLRLWDRHEGNIGVLPNGRPVVIDPGAIEPMAGISKAKDLEVFADMFGEPTVPKKSTFDAEGSGDMLERLLAEEGFARGGLVRAFAPGGEVKKDLDEDGRPIHYYTAYGDDVRSYSNRAEFEAGRKSFKQMGSGKRDLDEDGRPVHYYTAVGDDIRSYANKTDYMAGKRDKYVPVTPELAVPTKPAELYPDPNLPDTKMADLENMVEASRRFEKYRNPEPVTSTKPSDLLLDPNVALAYKSFWGEGTHDATRYIGKKYDQAAGWLGEKWQGTKDTVSAVADWKNWMFKGGEDTFNKMKEDVYNTPTDFSGKYPEASTYLGHALRRRSETKSRERSSRDRAGAIKSGDFRRALSRNYTDDMSFEAPIKYGMTDVGRGMTSDFYSLMTTPVDTHKPRPGFFTSAQAGTFAGEGVGGEPLHMKAIRDALDQSPGSRLNFTDVRYGTSGQTNLIPEPKRFSLLKAARTHGRRMGEVGIQELGEAAAGAGLFAKDTVKATGKVAKNVYDMTVEEIAELYGVTLQTARQIHKGLAGTAKEALSPTGFALGGPVGLEADYLRRSNDTEDEKERWAIDSSREYMAKQRELAEGAGLADMAGRKSFMGIEAQFQTDQLARSDERRSQFENQLDSYRTFRDTTENNTNKLGAYEVPSKISSALNRAFNPVSQDELKANLFNRRKDLDFGRIKGPYISQFKSAYDTATDAMASGLAKADEQKAISDWKAGLEQQMRYLAGGGDPHSQEFQEKGLKSLRAGRAPILAKLYKRKSLGLIGDIHKEDNTTGAKASEAAPVKYDQGRIDPGLNKDLQESAGLAGGLKTIFSDVGSAFSSIKDFVKKVIDPFKSLEKEKEVIIPKKLANGGLAGEDAKYSATQYHSGGVVAKTGKIFAEAGEVITPKKLANGGLAEMETAPASSANNKDFSDIVSKLESIELKVEERELKVEDKTFTVEDKTFKIDAPDSIPIDTSNVPKIEVEQPSWMISVDTDATVKVEQPSWTIPVEVPTDTVKVSVDATTAASELKQALSSAVGEIASTLSNIDVSGASGNAVGGEAFNQLAQTVQSVNDRLLFVKGDLENKIRMVGDKQSDVPEQDVARTINVAIENRVAGLRQELNDMKTEISSLGSAQRRNVNTLDARLEQIQYDIRIAQNSIGTNGIGRYS